MKVCQLSDVLSTLKIFGYLEETCNQFIGWVSTSLVTLRVGHDWSDLAAAAAATQPMCECGYLYTVLY